MYKIVDGIRRFRSEVFANNRKTFESLAGGQSPEVLLITCSDSRVVPHMVTQAGPGDLFIIRNAGNLVPPFSGTGSGEEATIEYAVAVLQVKHIVVCGHSNCGAIKGLLDPASLAAVPSVAKWLSFAASSKAASDALYDANTDPETKLTRTIEINALRQLDNLRSHPSVAAALSAKKVELHAWVYDIPSGAIVTYDDASQSFKEIEDSLHPVASYLTLSHGS